MEWQTLITLARAAMPAAGNVLEEAGKLGAFLKNNGFAGWEIGWNSAPGVHHEQIMDFRGARMKPMLRELSILLAGLPCYVGEPDILWDTHGALQKEMFQIKGQIDQARQNNEPQTYFSLLKRLTAVRILWNNTRERKDSGCLWALIFDELARYEPYLCPYIVALYGYRVPVDKELNPADLPGELVQKYPDELNRLVSIINNGGLLARAKLRLAKRKAPQSIAS